MLTREEVFNGLKEVLLMIDPSKEEVVKNITEDSRLVEDIGLASVSLLYLVIAVEEKFNIEFGDLGVEDFKTVKQTIDYILDVQK
jgi:acyl carrier protein